jgi:hypothetical protein
VQRAARGARRAAREFAQIELADHKHVMVLHDHQANPHVHINVHISVRAESKHGKRLNPRKADLHRWRETFAEKLRGHGVEAESIRQATRGRSRNHDPLWRLKAREEGRLRTCRAGAKGGEQARATRTEAVKAWMHVGRALALSGDAADRDLARSIATFIKEMPATQAPAVQRQAPEVTPQPKPIDVGPRR